MIITFGISGNFKYSYNTKTKQFNDLDIMWVWHAGYRTGQIFTWFIFDPYNGEKINKKFLKKMYLEAIKN